MVAQNESRAAICDDSFDRGEAKCPCTLEHHRILISRTIQSYFGQVSLTMVRSVTVK
jgi:hypothetical protein